MENVIAIKNQHRARMPIDTDIQDLYRNLTPAHAQELARHAIELLDRQEERQARDILIHLACLAPEGLAESHRALLERQLLDPGILFRNAGAETREQLIDAVPGANLLDTNLLLLALVWIGDEHVQEVLQTWQDDESDWVSSLYVPPAAYAQEAGWELTLNGQRRDLFFHQCYPLIEDEGEEPGTARILPAQDRCQWCGRDLVTLLDLDLADARLAFLDLHGSRLRIATCESCACFGPVYTGVDGAGGARWSEHNTRPAYLPENTASWGAWKQAHLVLGREPRGPFDAAYYAVSVPFSQVGGHPTWLQDASYPTCPSCDRLMPALGQVAAEDIDEYGEGIYYAFLCTTCSIACTLYQQT